ncbi:hypothetical protein EW146_g8849 [Bondarzewia mesenterica]|uniref:Uncharacterized protein n=1 Tax=Bondarzewia mesenterica TaxID=1095465 RepID=A0A4S4LGE2_9AGAM|nr:hypothetical protein EW146_g8849 [Bondarzewia mesenterica]
MNMPGGARHPPSAGPSRRGSFSAPDDGMRPSSMQSAPGLLPSYGPGASPMHRPLATGPGILPPPSRTNSEAMMGVSPPRSNRLPPAHSPTSTLRSPPRFAHSIPPLPPPPYPTGIDAAAAGKSVLLVPPSPSTKKRAPSPPMPPPTRMTIMDGLPSASARVSTPSPPPPPPPPPPPSLPPMEHTDPLPPPSRAVSPPRMPPHLPPGQNSGYSSMPLRLPSLNGPPDSVPPPPPPKVAVGDAS